MRNALTTLAAVPQLATSSYRSRARALFLLAAGVSFVLSVSLWFSGNELEGIFVGLWVPSILALGALALGGPER